MPIWGGVRKIKKPDLVAVLGNRVGRNVAFMKELELDSRKTRKIKVEDLMYQLRSPDLYMF